MSLLRRRRAGAPDEAGAAPRVHVLALDHATWGELDAGRRTFDVRLDTGRGFAVGDVVAVWELRDGADELTRRACAREITHIAPVYQHVRGMIVVLALAHVDGPKAAAALAAGPPDPDGE